MKAPYFLLFFSCSFILDQLGALFIPGGLWLMPLVLLMCMIFDRSLDRHIGMVLMCGVITDLYSGLPFGYVTMGVLVVLCGIVVLRKWVRI